MAVPLVALEPEWVVMSYKRGTTLHVPESHEDFDVQVHRPGAVRDPAFPQGREKMGLMFCCPRHYPLDCDFAHLMVPFSNPVDGGPPAHEGQGKNKNHWWSRTGDTFETLSLTPSIKFPEEGPEHWHGFVTQGQVI